MIPEHLHKYEVDASEIIKKFYENKAKKFPDLKQSTRFKELVCALIDELVLSSTVREFMSRLLCDLSDIKDSWRGENGKSYKEIFHYKEMQKNASLVERFDNTLGHLKEAALLLDLPENYFFEKASHKSNIAVVLDKTGLRKLDFDNRNSVELGGRLCEVVDNTSCNTSEEGVPRFEDEADEFYNKRLPPEERAVPWSKLYILAMEGLYGERGGGPKADQPKSRFINASVLLVAGYVSTNLPEPFAIISDLLRSCGIEVPSKAVRTKLDDEARRKDRRLGKEIEETKVREEGNRNKLLRKLDNEVLWTELVEFLAPYCPHIVRRNGEGLLSTLLRVYFVQQWLNLSDEEMVRAMQELKTVREFFGGEHADKVIPCSEVYKDFRESMERFTGVAQLLMGILRAQNEAVSGESTK